MRYCAGFFPSALLDDTGAGSEACFDSSDAGVTGLDVVEGVEANCHAGMLGFAPEPMVDAAGTLGASSAFAAILISVSPC